MLSNFQSLKLKLILSFEFFDFIMYLKVVHTRDLFLFAINIGHIYSKYLTTAKVCSKVLSLIHIKKICLFISVGVVTTIFHILLNLNVKLIY